MLELLAQLRDQGVISMADYYFAKFINDKQQGLGYSETQQALSLLLAALCHNAYLNGDSCIQLKRELANNCFGRAYHLANCQEQWVSMLAAQAAFTTTPKQIACPFVLQGERLYLYRAWQDEQYVADYIKSAVKKSRNIAQPEQIKAMLTQFFGSPKENSIDWQKVAVATALSQSFCLIAGGPGTGKTYSVARLLASLQQLQIEQHLPALRIRLAAPTGKAAARLKESIDTSLNQLGLNETVRQHINTESETIHRLLGVRPFDDTVRFNEKNPLPLDVLIVDEASMIDLTLMAKLLRALPKQARLVLLGDKDQLASVEAGAILGELGDFFKQDNSVDFAQQLQAMTGENVPYTENSASIRQCLALLRKSTRFNDDSLVGRVAKAINEKTKDSPEKSWAILKQSSSLVEFNSPENENELPAYRQKYLQSILHTAVENYQSYLKLLDYQDEPTDTQLKSLFIAFNSVRFLTALRVGDFGVESLNVQIAEALRQNNLVTFNHSRDWFVGKPIMVTENDENVGLFNGDIGIYLGKQRVYFETGSGFKRISINRVPAHEMAFAMTIHKSQGSEFAHTFVVLPPENSPILSKELLYTAVTRAKPDFTVFTSEAIWKSAVGNPIKRQSGLGALLMEDE